MSVRFLRFNAFGARERDASFERLLARADALAPCDWRGLVYERLAPGSRAPAPAALALLASGERIAARALGIATPVHYVAELANVRLPVGGLLKLARAAQAALAADFNRLWADAGVQLHVSGEVLLVAFDSDIETRSVDPERALGRHLAEFLPQGRDGARLRRLMSEIEMWLHDHPLNLERKAHAEPPLSGLWLWGFGAPLAELPRVTIAARGDDPMFCAYAVADARHANLLITRAAPTEAEWQSSVAPWLEMPGDLLLSAGEASFALGAGARWRFWRRMRPWWVYFE